MAQDELGQIGAGGDCLNMAPLVEPIRDKLDSHMGDRQGTGSKAPCNETWRHAPKSNNKGTLP